MTLETIKIEDIELILKIFHIIVQQEDQAAEFLIAYRETSIANYSI